MIPSNQQLHLGRHQYISGFVYHLLQAKDPFATVQGLLLVEIRTAGPAEETELLVLPEAWVVQVVVVACQAVGLAQVGQASLVPAWLSSPCCPGIHMTLHTLCNRFHALAPV